MSLSFGLPGAAPHSGASSELRLEQPTSDALKLKGLGAPFGGVLF